MRGHAHAGGYRLEIVDHGVGMPADELDVANTRLSGAESFTVAPSRYLGHYVVGRQASRLGLTVHLRDTPGGGTTAEIEIGAVIAPAEAVVEPVVEEPERAPATGGQDLEAGDRPETLIEALGRPQARPITAEDAMDDAPDRKVDRAVPMPAAATTGSGYTRRVRGANAPDTGIRTARAGRTSRQEAGGPEAMRDALNRVQAGMERSRSEDDAGGHEPGERDEPEGR
jgi:hypothetical protein